MESQPKNSELSVECLTPNQKWLRLFQLNWAEGTWTFASRKAVPEAVSGETRPDAVIIVPTLMDESGRKLIIIKEFRVVINDYEFGFPAGLIDGNESPEETARRELKEETGFEVRNVEMVSPPVYSSPGLTDESCVLVFVTVNPVAAPAALEAHENIETLVLGPAVVRRLVFRKNEFANAKIGAKSWPVMLNFLREEEFAAATMSNILLMKEGHEKR